MWALSAAAESELESAMFKCAPSMRRKVRVEENQCLQSAGLCSEAWQGLQVFYAMQRERVEYLHCLLLIWLQ
jgi:hypothetical protein